ncbi:MAG: ORF6N domain-containing protein [Bacteroidetes bacterium]|nr:ORF6N domain-containing protein [Bacteroidota bacterium]
MRLQVYWFELENSESLSVKPFHKKNEWGGRRKLPFAFTEHGVLMLSSVLSSKIAIQMNIRIMRVYVRLREVLSAHQELRTKIDALETKVEKNNADVAMIFQALRQLMEPPEVKERKRIGYKQDLKEPPSSLFAL